MIIKLEKILNVSSEHPQYPASNLLKHNCTLSWRCAKPGERLSHVTFQFAEPSCIIGLDIGNYRSCVVIVTASTEDDPENWVPIVNHQFMTHDEAADGKFKDQVQLFTKKELNPDILKTKFNKIKVTCMQSANLKELFGLTFIILRTEIVVDLGVDVFGRFKLKENTNNEERTFEKLREKYMRDSIEKKGNYKTDLLAKIKETSKTNYEKRQNEERLPMKRPLLEKLEAGKSDEVFGYENENSNSKSLSERKKEGGSNIILKNTIRTPFGDVVTSNQTNDQIQTNSKGNSYASSTIKSSKCSRCSKNSDDKICDDCGKVVASKKEVMPPVKKIKLPLKPKKLFGKLMEDVTFSLSGYVNPQRDNIRKKALQMGARYLADPNTTNKRCTHLVCAFKNTPKYQQLKGHAKIVSHTFIENCFAQKKRLPWRRYALDNLDKNQPESEEEIEGSFSPIKTNPFEIDTDPESD